MKEYKNGRYMMATKSIHDLGDISSDEPDLCIIWREDEDNYIGNWVSDLYMVQLKFPKETTKPLTEKEKNKYVGKSLAINNNPPHYRFKKEDFEWDE